MRRLALLSSALFLTDPALALDAPVDGEKTFWCGYAFTIVAAEAKAPEQAEGAKIMAGQGAQMLAKAEADYRAAGFTADAITGVKVLQEETAKGQVFGPAAKADYSYVECLAIATQ
jgi:hypothetical protein